MPAELVVDASVIAKCVLDEEDSPTATALLRSGPIVVAPDFALLELASIMAKSVRRGRIDAVEGRKALMDAWALVETPVPSNSLAGKAFDLAVEHGFSTYDALYLALAASRDLDLVTADRKLVRRANEAGLAFVRDLAAFR